MKKETMPRRAALRFLFGVAVAGTAVSSRRASAQDCSEQSILNNAVQSGDWGAYDYDYTDLSEEDPGGQFNAQTACEDSDEDDTSLSLKDRLDMDSCKTYTHFASENCEFRKAHPVQADIHDAENVVYGLTVLGILAAIPCAAAKLYP